VAFAGNIQRMVMSKPLPAAALIRTLESLGPLSAGAKDALVKLPHAIREIRPHEIILREGDEPSNIYLLLEGCVFRSTVLMGGGRQIMALHIPGAILNLQNLFLAKMDHSVSALMRTTVALIPHREIRTLIEAHPLIAIRLWHETFIDAAISRKWLTGVGRRTAYANVAHFICEFVARMRSAGMSDGQTCDVPLTQSELGDALGLSTVHVNRTLKKLHQDGIVTWGSSSLVIHNTELLIEVADFDETYLELLNPGAD
jgi:CRP-like cAMP-binding protein